MYYFWNGIMLPREGEELGKHLHSTCTGIDSPRTQVPLSGSPYIFSDGKKTTRGNHVRLWQVGWTAHLTSSHCPRRRIPRRRNATSTLSCKLSRGLTERINREEPQNVTELPPALRLAYGPRLWCAGAHRHRRGGAAFYPLPLRRLPAKQAVPTRACGPPQYVKAGGFGRGDGGKGIRGGVVAFDAPLGLN